MKKIDLVTIPAFASQTLAAFDFDDIEAVDGLTDDEIDEILLSIIGEEEEGDAAEGGGGSLESLAG